MIFGVATRHPLQRALVVESTESARNRLRHAIKSFGIIGDGVPQLLQLRSRRHPDPCAEPRFPAGLKVEVVAGASGIRLRADGASCVEMVEPAGRVGLVRRLVFGEANVAVNTEHRSLGIATDLRRKPGEACVEILDQLSHRLAYLCFVLIPMRFEPRLLVVPGEAAKESERAFGEWHRSKDTHVV